MYKKFGRIFQVLLEDDIPRYYIHILISVKTYEIKAEPYNCNAEKLSSATDEQLSNHFGESMMPSSVLLIYTGTNIKGQEVKPLGPVN